MDGRRHGQNEDPTGLKWHVTYGQNYDVAFLDDRRHWERHGIDPDKHIRDIRACGDREATKRGLMFIGEIREGKEIQRQYIVPTFWLRVKEFLFRLRCIDPALGQERCMGIFWPKLEMPRKETR